MPSLIARKLRLLPGANLLARAGDFLPKVWTHILTGVGGPNGGNGSDLKFGALLGNYRHMVDLSIPMWFRIDPDCAFSWTQEVSKGACVPRPMLVWRALSMFIPLRHSGVVLGGLTVAVHF